MADNRNFEHANEFIPERWYVVDASSRRRNPLSVDHHNRADDTSIKDLNRSAYAPFSRGKLRRLFLVCYFLSFPAISGIGARVFTTQVQPILNRGPSAFNTNPTSGHGIYIEFYIKARNHRLTICLLLGYPGPYSCIGKQLALMEVRAVTARLVSKFDISFGPGEDGSTLLNETHDCFTLHLAPLNLQFEDRK